MWLPQETEFAGARIFTYGYNSNYKGRSSTSWRIVDFAKDLLLRLLTFTETAADGSNGRMGKVSQFVHFKPFSCGAQS